MAESSPYGSENHALVITENSSFGQSDTSLGSWSMGGARCVGLFGEELPEKGVFIRPEKRKEFFLYEPFVY